MRKPLDLSGSIKSSIVRMAWFKSIKPI